MRTTEKVDTHSPLPLDWAGQAASWWGIGMMTISVCTCIFLPSPWPENITSRWETNFICFPLPLLKTWSRNVGLDRRDDGEKVSSVVTRVAPLSTLISLIRVAGRRPRTLGKKLHWAAQGLKGNHGNVFLTSCIWHFGFPYLELHFAPASSPSRSKHGSLQEHFFSCLKS